MFELLPNTQKNALKREYLSRVTIIALSFLLAIGTLSLVALSPSYFLSVERDKVAYKELENIKKFNGKTDDEKLRADIENSKEMISMLRSSGEESSIKDLILKIISKKNPGVMISGVSVSSSKKEQYQIIVKGTAKNRELLKSFAEDLRGNKEFGSIDLPISNFAKISDIDFNITLKTAI